MVERKWTPGPWMAVKKAEGDDYVYGFDFFLSSPSYGCVGYWIGGKDNHKDERWCLTEHDANLISAAPDLYDALEKLLALQTTTEGNAQRKARAALAKARGEKV